MGTNYYIANLQDPYDDPPGWHIGKQSFGWPWCWADPPMSGTIAEKWLIFAEENPELNVVDEYGKACGPLLNFVANRLDSDYHAAGKGWS